MNFVTTSFALFFLPVLFIVWGLKRRPAFCRLFLLVASLFFYAWAGPQYLLLLLAVALLNWGTVRLIAGSRAHARLWVGADVALHVLILAFFKYYESLALGLGSVIGWMGADASCVFSESLAEMAFPIGLSFYTFQGLSYVIDHYRKPELPARCFTEVLSYVSFFPTIMAGPIMREGDFFPQWETLTTQENDFREGAALILSGLLKKVVLASYLSVHLVDPVFHSPENYSALAVAVAAYGYAIQIFCDFSGYTDLALGIGRLMGFRLPPNFESPYLALNLQDFWRRWHISLSSWLRDYLYIPLGGSRRGNRYVNLILTMLIGGIWHGSGLGLLTFVVWGAMHGVILALVHAWHQFRKRIGLLPATGLRSIPGKLFAWLLTMHVVVILWVFFRADDVETAITVLKRSVDFSAVGEGFPVLALPAIAAGMLLQVIGPWCFRRFAGLRLPLWLYALLCGLCAGVIFNMGPDGALPFIYFSF